MAFPSPEASGPSSSPSGHDLRAERPHAISPAAASPPRRPAGRPLGPASWLDPRPPRRSRSRPATRPSLARVACRRRALGPAAAVAILLVATAISSAPALAQPGSVGNTAGGGSEARIAVGGVPSAIGGPGDPINDSPYEGLGVIGAGIDGATGNDGPTGPDGATTRDDRDDRRDRVRRRHAAQARRRRHDRRRRQRPDADLQGPAPATRSPASPASSASR